MDGGRGLTILPDNRVVYSGDHAENWDLFITDMDGQNKRQLSFDDRFHESPTACDNGQSIVYSSNAQGIQHLWKLDLKGGSPVQLTNGFGESDPACAGAGDTIYYVGRISGGQMAIFKMRAAGGEPVQVSKPGPVGRPCVSFDGKHLLFWSARKDGTAVFLTISTDSGKTESEYPVHSTVWFGTSWMPDNRSFAVGDLRSGVSNVWALPLLGAGPEKQITHYTSGSGVESQYSPDGKWLVLARGPDTSNAVLFREAGK